MAKHYRDEGDLERGELLSSAAELADLANELQPEVGWSWNWECGHKIVETGDAHLKRMRAALSPEQAAASAVAAMEAIRSA